MVLFIIKATSFFMKKVLVKNNSQVHKKFTTGEESFDQNPFQDEDEDEDQEMEEGSDQEDVDDDQVRLN